MPSIQRRDGMEAEPLGKRYHRSIDRTQGQIAIAGYELGDPDPIAGENRCGREVSRGEIPEEPHFC